MTRGALVLAVLAALGLALAQPAAREPAVRPEPVVRVVVFGDFNGPYGSTTYGPLVHGTVRRIVDDFRPALVLAPGDVVAGQKASLTTAQRDAMWRGFERDVASPLRQAGIPVALAVGNHDGSSLRDARGRLTYAADRETAARYWNDPAHVPRLEFTDRHAFPFDYAFRVGSVFVAVVDASSNTLASRAWLDATLASRPAREARLRLVMGHLPLYGISAAKNRPGDVLKDGDELRALLERHRVHTYVSGHHAAYYPARRGRLSLLHAGGIGGRDYVEHPGTARSTVTLLEIDAAAGDVRDTTLDAATGREVPITSLPPRLDGLNGTVTRLDLAR